MQGGFQQSMTRREAAQILGIREHSKEDIVKDAHRKIMIANHPDAGQALLTSRPLLGVPGFHFYFIRYTSDKDTCRQVSA